MDGGPAGLMDDDGRRELALAGVVIVATGSFAALLLLRPPREASGPRAGPAGAYFAAARSADVLEARRLRDEAAASATEDLRDSPAPLKAAPPAPAPDAAALSAPAAWARASRSGPAATAAR